MGVPCKGVSLHLPIVMLQGGFEKNIVLVFTSPTPGPLWNLLMHKFRAGSRDTKID